MILYLYGEKVKSLSDQRSKTAARGMTEWPNDESGMGGGRYNKVTLKKVSKIKCFRSFSQHRNEALLP